MLLCVWGPGSQKQYSLSFILLFSLYLNFKEPDIMKCVRGREKCLRSARSTPWTGSRGLAPPPSARGVRGGRAAGDARGGAGTRSETAPWTCSPPENTDHHGLGGLAGQAKDSREGSLQGLSVWVAQSLTVSQHFSKTPGAAGRQVQRLIGRMRSGAFWMTTSGCFYLRSAAVVIGACLQKEIGWVSAF